MAVTDAAPTPVYPAVGAGAWGAVQELRASRDVRLVTSPRAASVLLVAGRVPDEHREALGRVHDQLPHPRRTVGWRTDGPPLGLDVPVVDGGADDVSVAVRDALREVLSASARSEPDVLPDVEPNEWRGVGPHGQGGEGMMGGVPYGRPMAMTGPDRDGLQLDRLHVAIGPFLPLLPPGVVLDVTLQGPVIQEITDRRSAPPAGSGTPAADVWDDGPIGARRRRLRWLAHALQVHGLPALAVRAATLARDGGDDAASAARLRRRVVRSGLVRSLHGVGHIDGLGDCAERWRDRLDRLVDDATDDPPLPHDLWGRLEGFTWQSAIATLVSVGWTQERRLPAVVA